MDKIATKEALSAVAQMLNDKIEGSTGVTIISFAVDQFPRDIDGNYKIPSNSDVGQFIIQCFNDGRIYNAVLAWAESSDWCRILFGYVENNVYKLACAAEGQDIGTPQLCWLFVGNFQ